ncbi:MAG: hypothetical protein HY286_19235 [Planctomycetes bacterium]|nr:hypothetical protein [Planctomycetota bacterium]
MKKFLRALLTAELLFTAAVKLLGGHRREYALAPPIFYIFIILELALAAALLSAHYKTAAYAACCFFAASLVWTWMHPAQECGCFGALGVFLAHRARLFISAVSGACAALLALSAELRIDGARARGAPPAGRLIFNRDRF